MRPAHDRSATRDYARHMAQVQPVQERLMGSLRDRSAFPFVGQDYPEQQGLGAHLPNIDVKRYPRLLKKYTVMQTWPPQSITQRVQAGPMRGSCYCGPWDSLHVRFFN